MSDMTEKISCGSVNEKLITALIESVSSFSEEFATSLSVQHVSYVFIPVNKTLFVREILTCSRKDASRYCLIYCLIFEMLHF